MIAKKSQKKRLKMVDKVGKVGKFAATRLKSCRRYAINILVWNPAASDELEYCLTAEHDDNWL